MSSIRRPHAGETEEDILASQAAFERELALRSGGAKSGTTVVRVKKRVENPSSTADSAAGTPADSEKTEEKNGPLPPPPIIDGARFTIDLDAAPEQLNYVLGGVTEQCADIFYRPYTAEQMQAMAEASNREDFSKEDGFPQVLDLSAYFDKSSNRESTRRVTRGKSFFAAEFDRLNGRINDGILVGEGDEISGEDSRRDVDKKEQGDYQQENTRRLMAMTADELQKARTEIEEKLDPTILAFLRDRHLKRAAASGNDEGDGEKKRPAKVSKFKRERAEAKTTASNEFAIQSCSSSQEDKAGPAPSDEATQKSLEATTEPASSSADLGQPPPPPVDDFVSNLELLEEFGNEEDREKYDRLAIDAVRLDLASKSMRHLQSRQQKRVIGIFDQLANSQHARNRDDELLQEARTRMEDIKKLYLEELQPEDGPSRMQFAHGVNPLYDVAWMLGPIRRVAEAIRERSSTTAEATKDDVDLVRLSLLFTVLLLTERPTVFYAFVQPPDVYVRVAEVFLLGRPAFTDPTVCSCVRRILDGYLLPSATDGRLAIRMQRRVAELDAFAPFYDRLLKSFEAEAMGDELFAVFLMLPAYASAHPSDAIQMRLLIWAPERNVARQITLDEGEVPSLFAAARQFSLTWQKELNEEFIVPYTQLMGAYHGALQAKKVTRERNPGLYVLANEEVETFKQRHSAGGNGAKEGREEQR